MSWSEYIEENSDLCRCVCGGIGSLHTAEHWTPKNDILRTWYTIRCESCGWQTKNHEYYYSTRCEWEERQEKTQNEQEINNSRNSQNGR
jgi:hypothetical protein